MQKSATVYSNDPVNPVIKLSLSAFVKTSISHDFWGVMLSGIVGQEIKKVVNFNANLDKPLIMEIQTSSLPGKFLCELKCIEKGKKYQLIIKNISKKENKYNGFITLKTNYTQKPEITIRVLGFIQKNQK